MKYIKERNELFEGWSSSQISRRLNELKYRDEFKNYGKFEDIDRDIYFNLKGNQGMHYIQVDAFDEHALEIMLRHLSQGYEDFIIELKTKSDSEIEGIMFNQSQQLIGIVDEEDYMFCELLPRGWEDTIMFSILFTSKGKINMFNKGNDVELENNKIPLYIPERFIESGGKNNKKTIAEWSKYIKEGTIVKDAILKEIDNGNFVHASFLKRLMPKKEYEKIKHLGQAGDHDMFN